MTKTDFIKNLATDNNITVAEAQNMLEKVAVQVERSLKEDSVLSFPGYGKFEVKHRDARKTRNPQTGEMMDVPAKNMIKFKAGSKLNAMFN